MIKKSAIAGALAALTFTAMAGAAQAATVTVCASLCDATTIQGAIDLPTTHDGDTISVGAGTFQEQLDIDKSVTVQGTGVGTTTISSPDAASVANSFTSSHPNHAIVFADAPDVTIEDLTVDGRGQGTGSNANFVGIGAHQSSLTIDSVHVTHIRDSPLDGIQSGTGVYVVDDSGSANSVTITNSTIDDYQKNAIALIGTNLSVDVENNTTTGAGPQTSIAQNGIEIFGDDTPSGAPAPTGSLLDNTVTGNECDDAAGGCGPNIVNDVESGGFLLIGVGDLLVAGNTASGNDLGVYSQTDPGSIDTITDNTLTGNRDADVFLDAGNDSVTGNTIGGPSEYGIAAVSFSGAGSDVDAAIDGNRISGTDHGIFVDDTDTTDGLRPVVTANFNSVVGNTAGIVNASGPPAIDAANNWFGCTAGANQAGCDTTTGAVDADTHLVLTLTAAPGSIVTGGNDSTLTASLRQNSDGDTFTGGSFPSGIGLTFTTDLGTVAPTATITDGTATALLTSGATTGTATVVAHTTTASASTQVVITGPPSPPPTTTTTVTTTTPAPPATTVTTTAPAPPPTINTITTTVTTPAPISGQGGPTDPATAANTAGQALAGPNATQIATVNGSSVFGTGTVTSVAGGTTTLFALACPKDTCVAAVKGQLRLFDKHGHLTTLAVSTTRLTLSAGTAKLVRVKLSSSQRKAVRKAHRATIKVTLSVTDPATKKTSSVSKTFTLKVSS